MFLRRAVLRFSAVLVLAALWSTVALAQNLQNLSIQTAQGKAEFSVEFAGNEAERSQGLMFRRSLAPDRGMLFDFGALRPVSMWMQNTYVSLDMIFIRPDGTIARIAENTEPLSTRTITSGEPVLGVLEVVAGTAKRLQIKAGDKVVHPLFNNAR